MIPNKIMNPQQNTSTAIYSRIKKIKEKQIYLYTYLIAFCIFYYNKHMATKKSE